MRIDLTHQESFVAPTLERLADEFLGAALAIHLGGIDQGKPEIETEPEGGDFLRTDRPIFTHVPRTLTQSRHLLTRWQADSFHRWLFRNGTHSSFRYSCTNCTVMEPSPTADATRLTEPDRTSPAANTPGWLVSSKNGWRRAVQWADAASANPVSTKPWASFSISGGSHSIRGSAPMNLNKAVISSVRVVPVWIFTMSTDFSSRSPTIRRISVLRSTSMFGVCHFRRP